MRIKDNKLVKMESTGSLGYTYFKISLLGIALIMTLIIILIIEVNAKAEGVGVSGEGYKVSEDMDELIEKARKEREEKEVELNGKCERVGRDCIEPGASRVINGKTVYRDCW